MNKVLRELAVEYQIESPEFERLRLSFALDCVDRVSAHIIDASALAAFDTGRAYAVNQCEEPAFNAAVDSVLETARSKPGSSGLDGSGNAAVSAMNALAKAMSDQAIEAAEYAAYASVYAYSSHAATNPAAYKPEYQWQVERFKTVFDPVNNSEIQP